MANYCSMATAFRLSFPKEALAVDNTYAIAKNGGEKRISRILSDQRTLINVSVTSCGRLLTMILLSPDVGAAPAGPVGAVFGSLVLF